MSLFAALALGLSGIFARLILLQVRDASAYTALARDQRVRDVNVPATRGKILDRNGRALAISVPALAVYANPSLVVDALDEARTIAADLRLHSNDIFAKLTSPGTFTYLARGVGLETASALQARHLPGIGFLSESRREYPSGDLASQVLGVVGVDGEGLGGLELRYSAELAGRAGRAVVESDPNGMLIPQGTYVDTPPTAGEDLVLTIDTAIQFQAQAALARAVRQNKAKGGTVIVIDPATGEILAMTSYPSFDANDLAHATAEQERNRAVTDVYEPGSVNKVIAVAAALEEGTLTLNQRLRVAQTYESYGHVFRDVHTHPTEKMTLGDIVAFSSNVGAIQVAGGLGDETFYSYLERFGLTSQTGIDFPGEVDGVIDPVDQWNGLSMATIPIGQGIAVTPLQMVQVYATIANGGMWIRPHLVRETIGPDGEVHPVPTAASRRVVSAETAGAVARMLAYAVSVGTGQAAQVAGFWVAGKTGTAEKVRADGRGYGDKFVASFIGFTPASRPALVIAAILDEPVTEYGGVAAAPLFQRVASFALTRLHTPPAPPLPRPPHAVEPD